MATLASGIISFLDRRRPGHGAYALRHSYLLEKNPAHRLFTIKLYQEVNP